jgi:hypothetical protein
LPSNVFGFAAAAMLALGLAASGWFVGQGLGDMRKPERFVSVKGVAEQEVEADLALWALRFVATGNDLTEVQQKIAHDTAVVRSFLTGNGFEPEEIENRDLQVIDLLAQQYQQNEVKSRFIIAQVVTLRTTEVAKVAGAMTRLGELVAAGLVLSDDNQWSAGPSYVFSGLNTLKPAMIAEATRNARLGAEQFAADSGSGVGSIRQANQGVFQILPRDDFPGAQEAKQIHKTVRVVSTLDFLLEE